MPQMIPIRDLQNVDVISRMCRESSEPIFISKNGRSDMVVMSVETYERKMVLADIEEKLAVAAEQIEKGEVVPVQDTIKMVREKYGLYGA